MGLPAPQVIFAVDLGTTALKASAIARDGSVLLSAERPIRTYVPAAGHIEQCADEWWLAFTEAIAQLCADATARGLKPVALALSGQMQNIILCDEHVRPVRRVVLYSDTRAQPQAEAVARCEDGTALGERLAGYKGAASLLPKMLWLCEHDATAVGRAACLLVGAHSYLCARLLAHSAAARCFFADATTASVCGLIDPLTGGWALATLHALSAAAARRASGGPAAAAVAPIRWADLLPPIVGADEAVGALDAAALDELGGGCELLRGLPLFHGCGDAGAVTVGVGAGGEGGLYAYLGTSGWVAHTCNPSAAHAAAREGLFTLAHPQARPRAEGAARPALVLRAASCVCAGGSAEWLRSSLLARTDAAGATAGAAAGVADDEASHRPSYATIDALARCAPPGAGGLLFAPWLGGERSPFTDAAARGCFIGLSHGSGLAECSRALLEGVAFSVRALLDLVLADEVPPAHGPAVGSGGQPQAVGGRWRGLLVCGGVAKSAVWAQVLADILDLPVTLAADAEHAGARGAAILAGQPGGLGWFSRLDPPGFCPTGATFEPTADRAVRRLLDAQYALHGRLHAALRSTFAGLAAAQTEFAEAGKLAERAERAMQTDAADSNGAAAESANAEPMSPRPLASQHHLPQAAQSSPR